MSPENIQMEELKVQSKTTHDTKIKLARVPLRQQQASKMNDPSKKLKDKYLTGYSKNETKQSKIHQINKMITTSTPIIIQKPQQKRFTQQLA